MHGNNYRKKVYLISPLLDIKLDPLVSIYQNEWNKAEESILRSRLDLPDNVIRALLRRNSFKASTGLLSIGSFLKKRGYESVYIDESTFRTDVDRSVIIDEISEHALLVCITSLTPNYPNAAEFLKRIKKKNPKILIAMGGPHCTYSYQEALEDGADIVVHGEGEQTVYDIICALQVQKGCWQDVNGISYKHPSGSVVTNPPQVLLRSDEIPIVSYELLPNIHRLNYEIYIFNSRGCPYSCSYCVEGSFWKNVRYRLIDDVIKEINNHNIYIKQPVIFINDSSFGSSKKNTLELCNALQKKFAKMWFKCMIRADSVDEELAKCLRDANFIDVQIGIESGSLKILELMNKKESFSTYIEALNILRNYIPIIRSSWMVGGPYESLTTIDESINNMVLLFQEELIDEASVRVMVPYPGTDIYRNPSSFGLKINSHDWKTYHRRNFPPVHETKKINRYQIFAAYLQFLATATKLMQKRAI